MLPFFGQTSLPMDREGIEDLINQIRQGSTAQIGGQLSRSNIATAGNLASRGLGSSTIATGAMAENRAQALNALANLESQFAGMELSSLQELNRMRMQESLAQQQMMYDLFSGGLDVGGMAALGFI
jgi:hypothetical protein